VKRTQHGRKFLTTLGAVIAAVSLAWAPVAASDPPSDLGLELVAGGFTRPVVVTNAGDGSGRLFKSDADLSDCGIQPL